MTRSRNSNVGRSKLHCDICGGVIDPETDRHLLVTEQLVEPEMGLSGQNGRVLCAECMDPQVASLTSGLLDPFEISVSFFVTDIDMFGMPPRMTGSESDSGPPTGKIARAVIAILILAFLQYLAGGWAVDTIASPNLPGLSQFSRSLGIAIGIINPIGLGAFAWKSK